MIKVVQMKCHMMGKKAMKSIPLSEVTCLGDLYCKWVSIVKSDLAFWQILKKINFDFHSKNDLRDRAWTT